MERNTAVFRLEIGAEDGAGLGQCPMAGFGISSVEPWGLGPAMLVCLCNDAGRHSSSTASVR
jgi:hypothetical protein